MVSRLRTNVALSYPLELSYSVEVAIPDRRIPMIVEKRTQVITKLASHVFFGRLKYR